MNIHYCQDFDSMSKQGAELVFYAIAKKPNLLFCVASGASPSGLYHEMIQKHHSDPSFFSKLQWIKLDEWIGLPQGSTLTSEYDVQTKLLQALDVEPDKYDSFDPFTLDPDSECRKIQAALEIKGPIDICILGIGKNGHIALNEPSTCLNPNCHVEDLHFSTVGSGMLEKVGVPLNQGMTMGVGDILKSKMIVLFVTGKGKSDALKKLLEGKVNTDLPASLLWLHPNAHLLIDQTAVDGLTV